MKQSIFFVLLFLPFFIHAQQKGVTPIGGSIAASGTAHALVIGISDYQDAGIPSLKYAHIDAGEFANFLQSKAGGALMEDQIQMVTNEQATAANIYAKLDWLLEVAGENDRVIIYFSGHGDVETATSRNRGFLLAHDTPPTNYRIGALRVNDLNDILADLVEVNKAKVLLITDACRSGKLAGGGEGATATATALSEQFKNQIKIMSCQPDEFSLEGEQWGGGRGVFSYHLIDGLTGMADVDGNAEIQLFELDKYLKDKVPQETDFQQFPILAGPPKSSLSKVDAGELAALVEKRNAEMPMLASVNSKGRGDEILAAADSTVQQLYDEFVAALDEQYFLPIDINENRKKGKSASELYDILSVENSLQALHSNMKRNFVVALQDESQKSINAYLKADPTEMNERWKNFGAKYKSNPAYLGKAASLLGKSHYLYKRLISKKYYYEGLLLRLEGQKTNNISLFDLALEKEKLALQYDGEAAYIYNEMGMVYKELFKANKEKNNNQTLADSLYKMQILLFEKASGFSPKWVTPYTNRAGLYLINDEYEKSADLCNIALSLDSTQIGLKWYMGNIHQERKEYKLAEDYYKQVIAVDPAFNPDVYNNLGLVYFETGRYSLAEKMYLKSVEMDSMFFLAYKNLGLLYYISKNYKKSTSANLKCIAIDAEDSMPYFNIACVASLQGKGKDAVSWLEKAMEKGFKKYSWIKEDDDLLNARSTDAYREFEKKYFMDN
ncbi:MAG TPA: tetratricopeptide repeat protein [Bacteroidetes bacterium]|nr:tetratricopeptide repeat protein [Bacteroidota bacterium]